jgi:RecA/RadA recombinase
VAKKKKKSTKRMMAPKAEARASAGVGILGPSKLRCVVKGRVSTGCTALDAILGGPAELGPDGVLSPVPFDGGLSTQWGMPVGRISEVIGAYSTGKTALVENMAKQVQAIGGDVFMGITEATVDPKRMLAMGIDVDKIRFYEFGYIPEGFDWIHSVLSERKANAPPLLISWDTIGGSQPSDTRPGSGAREVREGLRMISNLVAEKNAIVLMVNQIAVTFDKFDYEPATPFGAGLRYHASIRIEFKGNKQLKNDDDFQVDQASYEKHAPIGILPTARCRKNKTFPPFRVTRAPLRFDGAWYDEFGIWLYLHTRKTFLESRPPNSNEPKTFGDIWTIKMPEPVSCYWSGWSQLLVDRPDVRQWLREQCFRLSLRGFNPVEAAL